MQLFDLLTAHGDRIALTADGRDYYAALADLGLRVAAGLRARGLHAGDRVAFFMPNRAELAIAYFGCFGCFAAGLVAVPLNSRYRGAEVEYAVADCAPPAGAPPPGPIRSTACSRPRRSPRPPPSAPTARRSCSTRRAAPASRRASPTPTPRCATPPATSPRALARHARAVVAVNEPKIHTENGEALPEAPVCSL
ncbi:MAG TPA: AMP-binding protein [Candidatus Dormibacteraeota bacterium]|nr:AMP-binding protein [Candidatus Dormibacteraeota bacterium]